MDYALLTKNNLTDPIIAEEKYEKDFRIRDTGRFYAWRNRLRLYARPAGRQDAAGQDGQEKEQEEKSCACRWRYDPGRSDSKADSKEEIAKAFFICPPNRPPAAHAARR